MPRQTLRQKWEALHAESVSTWDRLYPYAGPCGICGWPDKRHRLADAIAGMYVAGYDPGMIADDYGITAEVVIAVGEIGALTDRARRRARIRRDSWPGPPAT